MHVCPCFITKWSKNKRLLELCVECVLLFFVHEEHVGSDHKLKPLFSLDVSIGWRGELLDLGVKFLIGPVF